MLVEYRKWILELPCVEGLEAEMRLRVVLLSVYQLAVVRGLLTCIIS